MHALLQTVCARHEPAVLLVTHDVDEAILLADRVLVLVGGGIALDVRVELDRPRDRGHRHFVRMRDRLLLELGVKEPRAAVRFAQESRADSIHDEAREDGP